MPKAISKPRPEKRAALLGRWGKFIQNPAYQAFLGDLACGRSETGKRRLGRKRRETHIFEAQEQHHRDEGSALVAVGSSRVSQRGLLTSPVPGLIAIAGAEKSRPAGIGPVDIVRRSLRDHTAASSSESTGASDENPHVQTEGSL